MVVKTFRGQLADGGQDRIRLRTNDGKTGYKIVKFKGFTGADTFSTSVESVMAIWKTEQTTVTGTLSFSDSSLLAMFSYNDGSAAGGGEAPSKVIFDNEIFNQDIFITNKCDGSNTQPMNYYIELEVIPLASDEATVATLKNIRLNA